LHCFCAALHLCCIASVLPYISSSSNSSSSSTGAFCRSQHSTLQTRHAQLIRLSLLLQPNCSLLELPTLHRCSMGPACNRNDVLMLLELQEPHRRPIGLGLLACRAELGGTCKVDAAPYLEGGCRASLPAACVASLPAAVVAGDASVNTDLALAHVASTADARSGPWVGGGARRSWERGRLKRWGRRLHASALEGRRCN
jgi:hypothetical protein